MRSRAVAYTPEFKRLARDFDRLVDYSVTDSPPPPPHAVKIGTIALYQRESGYDVFVESGTHVGSTLDAASRIFRTCHSIELSEDLYLNARHRFRQTANVQLHFGSSDALLPGIVAGLNEPAIIWLDAHFSGDGTAGEGHDPLHGELRSLAQRAAEKHIVLIDDARGLGVSADELRAIANEFGESYHASVLHDSVRIVPKHIPLYGREL